MCIDEKGDKERPPASGGEESSGSLPSAGTITALLPKVSAEKNDTLHKMFALWIVRRKRSFSICHSDTELRDIFTFIFQGGYTPPCYETVVQKVLQLSAEAK
eukprot:gene20071-24029_t